MNEMIERVEQAIIEEWAQKIDTPAPTETTDEWRKRLSGHLARTAIGAMEEPTTAMVDACVEKFWEYASAQNTWRVMIAAALNEEQKAHSESLTFPDQAEGVV